MEQQLSQSEIEQENNQAPKFKIILPRKNDKNLIENYINQDYESYTIIDDDGFHDFVQKARENPEQYFNFGFTIDDLKIYLFKHLYMRMERTLIKKAIDEKKPKII